MTRTNQEVYTLDALRLELQKRTLLRMVAERGRKSPLRCPRHRTTIRRTRRISSRGAQPVAVWLVELLILSCLAGGAGDLWQKEVCYYISPNVVAHQTRRRVYHIHSVEIDTEEHVGKLQWARSSEAVRASLLVKKKKEKGKRRRSREKKQLVVIVPAGWKEVHEFGDQGGVRRRRAQFDHPDVLPQCGLPPSNGRRQPEDDLSGPREIVFRRLTPDRWQVFHG